jgi:hypothetical protein
MRRKGGWFGGAVDGRGRTRCQPRPGRRGSRDQMSPIVSKGEGKEERWRCEWRGNCSKFAEEVSDARPDRANSRCATL